MSKAPELLNCPFCGCNNIQILPNGCGDFFAFCGDDESGCGARSDQRQCESREQAAERWNTRPAHDSRLLRLAISTIEGLSEQQAMSDEWYQKPLTELRSALTAAESPVAEKEDDYDWKAHAALSDKEFCQMEDWLIGNADTDKNGLINRYERCKERIRDLIAKEGELEDIRNGEQPPGSVGAQSDVEQNTGVNHPLWRAVEIISAIGFDWRLAGAFQKVDASEYLKDAILKDRQQSLTPDALKKVREALVKIEGDFVPSNLNECVLAMQEMRDCASEALLTLSKQSATQGVADAERLDWLEKNPVAINIVNPEAVRIYSYMGNHQTPPCKTIRDAIDAAIELTRAGRGRV